MYGYCCGDTGHQYQCYRYREFRKIKIPLSNEYLPTKITYRFAPLTLKPYAKEQVPVVRY
jgi:hypothetical protein